LLLEGNAIILAGGDSKRIGYPKSTLKLGEQTLIEIIVNKLKAIFEEIIVVTDTPELFCELPVKLTSDFFCGVKKNSLRGIHAGLCATDTERNFVVACDMPFINSGLVNLLYNYSVDYQVVVPYLNGHFQPLFAFYQRSCLQSIEESLQKGDFKIINFYPEVKVKLILENEINSVDPEHLSFYNINTINDYKKAQAWIRAE